MSNTKQAPQKTTPTTKQVAKQDDAPKQAASPLYREIDSVRKPLDAVKDGYRAVHYWTHRAVGTKGHKVQAPFRMVTKDGDADTRLVEAIDAQVALLATLRAEVVKAQA